MLFVLLACAPAPEDSAAPGAVAPYLLDEGDDDPAAFDATSMEAALNQAVAAAISTTAAPVVAAYAAAMADSDADCPSWYADENGTPYWYDACTAESGATFSGYGYYLDYVGFDGGDGYLWTGPAMYVAASITGGSQDFTGSGSAYLLTGIGGSGETVYYSALGGDFTWPGSPWEDGGVPTIASWVQELDGARGAYVDGGLTLSDPGYDLVSFAETSTANPESGWPCEGALQGDLAIHGTDGVWYDVLFGGTWESETCSGCGDVWASGALVGEVCVNGSAWVDWASTPW